MHFVLYVNVTTPKDDEGETAKEHCGADYHDGAICSADIRSGKTSREDAGFTVDLVNVPQDCKYRAQRRQGVPQIIPRWKPCRPRIGYRGWRPRRERRGSLGLYCEMGTGPSLLQVKLRVSTHPWRFASTCTVDRLSRSRCPILSVVQCASVFQHSSLLPSARRTFVGFLYNRKGGEHVSSDSVQIRQVVLFDFTQSACRCAVRAFLGYNRTHVWFLERRGIEVEHMMAFVTVKEISHTNGLSESFGIKLSNSTWLGRY